jgi:hypothetical protein
MNTNADGDDLSRESHKEHLYKVARFLTKGAGGILAPIGLSTLVSESFDLFVKDPATKRRDRLLMDLMEQVARLTQDGRLSISDLQDNDDVAAVLVRATQAAVRSSGEEKLRALREAALKGMLSAAARVASPAQVIIGLLDRMTEHHVIRLEWEIRERMFYTYGDLDAESSEEKRRAATCFMDSQYSAARKDSRRRSSSIPDRVGASSSRRTITVPSSWPRRTWLPWGLWSRSIARKSTATTKTPC